MAYPRSVDRNRLLRLFAYGSVVSIYILILLGGYVTTSNSGLACGESWPLCNGQLCPSTSTPVLIECTHRVFNAVPSVFVIGTTLLAWTRYRLARGVLIFSTASFVGLAAQVLLGMLTVTTALDPVVSDAHLGLASAVFAVAVTNAVFVRNVRSIAVTVSR